MEFTNESERYQHGGLARECEAALVVAALQGLFLMEKENDGETTDDNN